MKIYMRHRRGRLFLVLASLALVLPVAAGSLTRALAQANGGGGDSIYRHLSVFTEVLSLIQRGYVDETSIEELFKGAFDGLSDGLDPLATYVPSSEVDRFRAALGVGPAHSGIRVARGAGISYVLAVEEGSPAAVAGIERGDIIAEVDGESTRGMPLWRLEVRLAEGSGTAALKLLRRGETLDIQLPLGPFARAIPTLWRHREVPVLRLGRIAEDSRANVEELMAAELGAEPHLVIDLRNLAGDAFDSAYSLAGLFAGGQLGELRRRGERLRVFEEAGAASWTGEVAVLVNSGTQGAGEVLARILEQSAGALLVGERTFGHAGRRGDVELGSDAVLFLSDAFYTGPDGEPIREALEPVERVEARRAPRGDEGTQPDRVLERAVDLLISRQQRQAA